jgi:hypothetical protein
MARHTTKERVMKTYTYQQCAENFEIWAEYVDPDGTMTRKEFDEMTTANKIQICVDCFGAEEEIEE